ncbi:class-III aminotransferase [Helicosporidium sp. ATCC 50920]|nr:class-III aminotransferase [Helicosporidium sp. ATCC 50920]|eukprot:KDD73829.1 class-III aminotransferase [Helicosporidium sp. ATCC 50920]
MRPSKTAYKALAQARALGKDYGRAMVKKHLPPAVAKYSVCTHTDWDVVVESASGCRVRTVDGRSHLDVAAGIGALSTGHCHPRVSEAIAQQASSVIMAQQNIFPASRPMVALLERFESVMPPHLQHFLFQNSGSEAVENAVKIARCATGRPNVISFQGGFHGRTYGAMALTTSKVIGRQNFGPLMPATAVAPFPYPLRTGLTPKKASREALEGLRWLLQTQSAPSETAALLVEPIQGEGGILPATPGFLEGLRALCDEHGMLLIVDEVQAGMARSGQWWSHSVLSSVQPDMLTFAKGIASGFPFGGVACRKELLDKVQPGQLGGTYGGSALGCAAASATIDVIRDEMLMDNVQARSKQLIQGLERLRDKFPIADIRGEGLMLGVEFAGQGVKGGDASKVTTAAGRHGLIMLSCGTRETVRFLPPLVIKAEEIDEALELFERALADVFA